MHPLIILISLQFFSNQSTTLNLVPYTLLKLVVSKGLQHSIMLRHTFYDAIQICLRHTSYIASYYVKEEELGLLY